MIKPGVRILGIRPELVLGLSIVVEVYREFGASAWFVITSVIDGTHSRASLHYTGCGADLRRPQVKAEEIVAEAKRRLGDDYDIMLEADHVHLEFQPKGAY